MKKINKVKRKIILFLINHFLSTTRYYNLKNKLLNFGKINVGKNTKVVGPFYCGTEVNITIGENCWIGKDFNIEGNGEVLIANNCDFAPSVIILTGSHKISNKERAAGQGTTFRLVIEEGCWIGARSVLFGNITIHRMSVVGAMSLVNKSVDNYTIVAGIPAKLIRKNN